MGSQSKPNFRVSHGKGPKVTPGETITFKKSKRKFLNNSDKFTGPEEKILSCHENNKFSSEKGLPSNRNEFGNNDGALVVSEASNTRQVQSPNKSPQAQQDFKKKDRKNSGTHCDITTPCRPEPRPFHMDRIQPTITYARFPRNYTVTVNLFNFKALRLPHCNDKAEAAPPQTPLIPKSPLSPLPLNGPNSPTTPRGQILTPLGISVRSRKRLMSSENTENLEDSPRRQSKRIKKEIKDLHNKHGKSLQISPAPSSKSTDATPKFENKKPECTISVLLSPLESHFPASVFWRTPMHGRKGNNKNCHVRIMGYDYNDSDSGTSFEEKEIELKKWILKGNDEKPLTEKSPGDVFVCDFCLSYVKRAYNVDKHGRKCSMRGMKPSDVIVYRKGDVSIFRVDGLANQSYCYNLMRLSKLYVDCVSGLVHATLFYFYVLYVNDHFAGYFSKEKGNDFTLGAILILPSHQRQGYGKLLIAFSYELSKHKGKIGTPERPLTPSGRKCFFAYWCETLVGLFSEDKFQEFHVEELSQKTYIHPWDILPALRTLGDLYRINTTFVFRLARNSLSPNANPSWRNPFDVSGVTWPAEE